MKKFISVFTFLFSLSVTNAAWVCYPPYGGGNGPHCFGSNGTCGGSPWSSCTCNGSDCCCYGATIRPNGSVDELYPIDNFGFEGNKLILYYQSQVVDFITLSDYLDEGELFVPSVSVISGNKYLILKVYDKNILDTQVAETGGVNPNLAYTRTITISLS